MDLISKEKVIEILENLPRWIMDADGEFQSVDPPMVSMLNPDDAINAVKKLESELIRCKDCKCRSTKGVCTRLEWIIGGKSKTWMPDDMNYCCLAERRKDGRLYQQTSCN